MPRGATRALRQQMSISVISVQPPYSLARVGIECRQPPAVFGVYVIAFTPFLRQEGIWPRIGSEAVDGGQRWPSWAYGTPRRSTPKPLRWLRMVVPLTEPQISHTRTQIIRMAIERQASISSGHPVVAEFWEVYEYLEGLDANGPVVNHSKKANVIAINLNDFLKCAIEHRQKVADVGDLRERLSLLTMLTRSSVGSIWANRARNFLPSISTSSALTARMSP